MMAALKRMLLGKPDPEAERHEARLAEAERTLDDLKRRATLAVGGIDDRHQRNHWQESIASIIKGG